MQGLEDGYGACFKCDPLRGPPEKAAARMRSIAAQNVIHTPEHRHVPQTIHVPNN